MIDPMLQVRRYTRDNLPVNIDKRIKRSKFAKQISELNDMQLKTLLAVLAGDQKLVNAVNCWSQSVEHDTQIEALFREIDKRFKDYE